MYFGIIINLMEFSIVKWTLQRNPSITVDVISIIREVGSKPKVTLIGILDLKKNKLFRNCCHTK